MQTLENKKVPNKLHRYREAALLRVSGSSLTSEELQNKRCLKFAPKYSRSIRIEPWKDAKLVNALKRIKKVDEVNEKSAEERRKNLWKPVLQNKLKTIQVYNFDQNLNKKGVVQKLKIFLNLREVLLDLASKPSSKKKEENQAYFTRNLLRYLAGMRKMKDIDLEISCKSEPTALEKLNSMSHLLSCLGNLWINRNSAGGEEVRLPPRLKDCQNILKKIAHLSIKLTSEAEADELFEALFEYSKNLTSLSMKLCEDQSDFGTKYLNRLKSFEKLENFQITLRNLFSFVENFTPPPSLKHITIDSMENSWKETSEKFFSQDLDELEHPAVRNLFENDKKLKCYFEKWSDLKNLVYLCLFIGQDSEEVSSILLFLEHLLNNISTLDTLDLYFQYCYGNYFGKTTFIYEQDQMVDLSLSEIFKALQVISKKIKTLRLNISGGHSIRYYSIPYDFAFPQFTQINFFEFSRCDYYVIQRLFDEFKSSSVDQKQMEILTFYDVNERDYEDHYESLLDFLKTIRKPPRNCKIDVNLGFDDLDYEKFEKTFNPFMEKRKKGLAVENVFLTVESSDYLKELSFLGEIFRNTRFVNQRTW